MKIHCIHPDWLMSCKRLAATAIDGINIGIIRINVAPSTATSDAPIAPKRRPAINMYIKQNKIKYQNSDLDALPSNLAYFPKHVLSDSANPIMKLNNCMNYCQKI